MTGTTSEAAQDQAPAKESTLADFRACRDTAEQLKREADGLALPAFTGAKPKDTLGLFADVDAAAKAAEKSAKALKDLRDAMAGDEGPVLEALDAMGLARAPLQGGPTIYRTRELWAGLDKEEDESSDDAYERVCAVMRGLDGLKDYVGPRFNTQSLSSYFRQKELAEEARIREENGLDQDAPVAIDPEDLIPAPLKGHIRLSEKVYAKAKTS